MTNHNQDYRCLVKFAQHANHFSTVFDYVFFKDASFSAVVSQLIDEFQNRIENYDYDEDAVEAWHEQAQELQNQTPGEDPTTRCKALSCDIECDYPTYSLEIIAEGTEQEFVSGLAKARQKSEHLITYDEEYAQEEDDDEASAEQPQSFAALTSNYQKSKASIEEIDEVVRKFCDTLYNYET
jgi:hypothetical protein